MANQSSNSDINNELKRLQNLLSKKAKVEEELNKISKEKETLWTAIPDMIFITDSKSKILDFKAERESELLISPKNVIGKAIDDLPLDTNAKKLFHQSFKKARKSKEVEIINYKAETIGGLGFFEARICPMSDDRFFVIIRNKTDEEIAKFKFIENDKILKQRTKEIANQNEEYAAANEELVEKNQTIANIMNELRWNETKFRQMFSSSPAGLFYWDTNLVITELNRAFSDALAAPFLKLKGLDMSTLQDKSVLPSIKSALKGKKGNYLGWYKATISGKKIFINLSTYPIYSKTDSKKIIGGAGLVEDLTEWKISQEKLEEKEENLRITLQSIADAVIVTDIKGAITNLNPVAEKLIGLKSKKLVGRLLKNVAKLKNSKTGEILPCSVDIAILEGKTISLTKNIEMYPISGFVYNVNFVVSPIYKTEENIVGAVVVIKDVSESYKIQNELYESESRFKSLFENSPTGIALIDINGNIMEVNNEILNILGSPSESATKKINVLTFEPLVNAGFSEDFHKCLLTHKSISRQTDYISKWRKGIIVQYTLSPFIEKNKQSSGVILNIFDVTSQKRLEEKEKKYFHDIEINAKASLELVDLSLDSDIFYFIGEKLKLFAKNQTIIVNRISQDQKEYNIEFVFAIDERLKQFKEIFNRPSQQIETNRNPNLHNRNKFIEIDPEHMLLASGNFDPKGVKKIIEIQEINKTYLFGLYAGDEYVGSIVVFTHKEEVLNNIEIIETFLNQVSLQIQKRQALQKLRDSEELYNNTLNSVSEYIHVTDGNQIILFANTSLKVVLKERGLNDNVAGHNINKAMPFLPDNVIDNYHRVIKTRKPLFSEETTIIKGQIFHTQTILTPVVEFNKVTRVITSIRDVTENKLSEIEISVLKELNESIVQNMNEGICMEDESGNIVMANPAFCRMMEHDLDKLIGKSALDFIPKHIHGMIKIAKLNLSAYKNKSFEIEVITESGKKVTALHSFGPIYQDNKLKYIVSVFTDISNRKLMEQNLLEAKEKIEESEKKFRELYEKSGDAILILRNGVFVDCNQAAIDIFKFKHKEEILNVHPSQLSPEIQADGDDSFKKAERMIATAIEKGTNRFLWEHKNSKGEIFPAEVLLTAILNENNEKIIHSVVRDISERRKAEKALHLSEERYRLISTVSSDYMFSTIVKEDDTLELDWVAGAFEAITGYSIKEYKSKGGWRFTLHPEDLLIDKNDFEKLKKNKKVDSEIRTVKKDGKIIWVRVFAHPLWDDKNKKLKGIYGAVQDITGRKSVELEILDAKQRAEESEEKFRNAFEYAAFGIVMVNSNGYFMKANHAMSAIMGYTEGELLKKTFSDITHPDDVKIGLDLTMEVLEGKRRYFWLEKRYIHKSGKIIWGRLSVSLINNKQNKFPFVVAQVQDITEQRRTNDALIESEKRLKLISDLTSDYIFQLDVCDDGTVKMSFISENFYNVTGRKVKDVMTPEKWGDVFHPDDYPKLMNCLKQLILTGETQELEGRTYVKEGKMRWVYVLAKARFDEETKKIIAIVGSVNDITERKKAQEALIKSENHFRNILELSNLAMAIISFDGIIEFINNQAIKTFGYLHEEIPNMDCWWKLAYPEENYRKKTIEQFMGLVNKAIEEKCEIERREYYPTCKDGSVKTMIIFGVVVEDKIFVMFEDITDRKKAEEELRRSEERYRSLVELSPEPIIVHTDGIIEYANNAAFNVMKAENKNNFIGKSAISFVHPDYRGIAIERIKNALIDGNEAPVIEEKFIRFDGRTIDVEVVGIPFENLGKKSMLTVFRDVTDINRTQQALKESELKYRTLIDSTETGFVILDEKGNVQDANQRFVDISGHKSLSEILNRNVLEWTADQAKENNLRAIEQCVKDGFIRNLEMEYIHKSGKIVPIEISATVVKTDNDFRILSLLSDITERKKAQKEIINALIKAEESDKLKSAFLANMSHELRTPINGIIGFSNLMLNQNLDIEKKEKYVSQINASSAMLLRLIEDIIDIAKIESGKMVIEKAPCNVSETLNELYLYYKEELKVRNKENILLVYNKYSDHDITVVSDPFRLRQVLNNLISNAVKFTSIGKIEFGFSLKDEKILFYVKDTGIGIEKENLNQIFDRFTQLEISHSRKFGGTGLGLTISKNIIELLNGEIWVESEANKGSSFYFTLPAEIVEAVEEKLTVEIDVKNFNWVNTTILIAEDDDLNFMFLEEMLQQTNLKIIRAKNGKEAVDLVHMIPEISLVLMDIQMPVMDGYESTKMIKSFKPDLPVIAQTAYAFASEKEMSIKAGCIDYISKPIDQKQLLKKIGKYLEKNKM